MKRALALIIFLVLMVSCFTGCSGEKTNNNDISENETSETTQQNENISTSRTEDEISASVNEGEFDPISIVKEEYITYDGGSVDYPGHMFNGGGRVCVVFPEDFDIEIIPGLYLKRMVRGSMIYSNSLDVIANNELLGSIEFYFVGETLKYNDINKLSDGDVIKLMFSEHKDSDGLDDNLAANGFSYVNIPEYITVPDLGETFAADDEITFEDIECVVSLADPKKVFYYNDFTYSEKPIAIYKGTAKSGSIIGDAVVLKLIYERVSEKTGYTLLVALTSCELTKHSNSSATCTFTAESSDGFNVGTSEIDMISAWNSDYTWTKLDY